LQRRLPEIGVSVDAKQAALEPILRPTLDPILNPTASICSRIGIGPCGYNAGPFIAMHSDAHPCADTRNASRDERSGKVGNCI
jgi:hypothetical protein